MRKVLLAAATTMACALVPASALAHEHGRDHARSGDRSVGLRSDTPGVAGRITSHHNDNLTITTNSGQVLSGKVTDDTAVFCIRPSSSSTSPSGKGDDEQGRDDQGDRGDDRGDRGDDRGDRGDDRGDRDHGDDQAKTSDSGRVIARCSPIDDLKPGRRIAAATLDVTPNGTVWKYVLVWD